MNAVKNQSWRHHNKFLFSLIQILIVIYGNIYRYVYMHGSYIPLMCQLKVSRSTYTLIATSTSTTQILVSNTLLQQNELGFPGETAESRIWAGNIQDEPGVSCSAKSKEVFKHTHTHTHTHTHIHTHTNNIDEDMYEAQKSKSSHRLKLERLHQQKHSSIGL